MFYRRKNTVLGILLVLCLLGIGTIGYFIYDINQRFPNVSTVERYTVSNPANENGLEITPLSHGVYTYEQYHEIYPNFTEFDNLVDRDINTYRIIVFQVRYQNKTDQTLQYETDGYNMIAQKSGLNNGIIVQGTSSMNTIEPGEVQDVVLSTVAMAGSLIKRSSLNKLEQDNFVLVYWWYPVQKELVFE